MARRALRGGPAIAKGKRFSMRKGAITLGDLRGRLAMLKIACAGCERAGQYRLDGLIARHGPEAALPDLLVFLSGDCPRRRSAGWWDHCGARFTNLPPRLEAGGFPGDGDDRPSG